MFISASKQIAYIDLYAPMVIEVVAMEYIACTLVKGIKWKGRVTGPAVVRKTAMYAQRSCSKGCALNILRCSKVEDQPTTEHL